MLPMDTPEPLQFATHPHEMAPTSAPLQHPTYLQPALYHPLSEMAMPGQFPQPNPSMHSIPHPQTIQERASPNMSLPKPMSAGVDVQLVGDGNNLQALGSNLIQPPPKSIAPVIQDSNVATVASSKALILSNHTASSPTTSRKMLRCPRSPNTARSNQQFSFSFRHPDSAHIVSLASDI